MKSAVLGIVFLTASFAAAQGPGMIPWWDGTLRRDIGLSDDQNRQINEILRETRPRLADLRRAVEAAETELRQELDSSQLDSRKANDAIEKVVSARSEMIRAVSQMSLKLRLILTPAQWQELEKSQRRGGGQRRMRQPPASERPGPP